MSPRAALVARVRATLKERELLSGARRALVACSGGPDSQVLLHVLYALRDEHGCELTAVSVNHGLRPEAIQEIAMASELAAGLGIPFVTLTVQVPAGASRQALARHARYEALFQCARTQNADRIAVGHTLDDQAETVLARLLRGTGIDGLAAIHPARADGVVRPLIDAPRSAVHAYAQATAIPFARDPSNSDPRYLRVRIRQTLLPRLCEENPQLPEQLAALAEDARDVAQLLAPEIQRAGEVLEMEGAVPFLALPRPVRRAALKAWAELRTQTPIQRTHLIALERMLFRGGQVRLPGDWVAWLDSRSHLVLEPTPKRGRGVPRPTKGER